MTTAKESAKMDTELVCSTGGILNGPCEGIRKNGHGAGLQHWGSHE